MLKSSQNPRHIAIIMDGNGRWARKRGLPRTEGHKEGIKTVERIIEAGIEQGIEILSLYAFSLESWKRPSTEVRALMQLFREFLIEKREFLKKE
ncbi:MAG: di-trans,poly-cis-decaprenylcistransferase, partial [Candidatus Omnitrophota bacterium]